MKAARHRTPPTRAQGASLINLHGKPRFKEPPKADGALAQLMVDVAERNKDNKNGYHL